MQVMELLAPERVLLLQQKLSKAKLLMRLSDLLVGDDAPTSEVTALNQALLAREQLGSTALGNGVAMPHARLPGLKQAAAAFVYLSDPVLFDSKVKGSTSRTTDETVDLVFAIATPEVFVETHLSAMSQIAALFDDPRIVTELRASKTSEQLFERLNAWFLQFGFSEAA